MSKAATKIHLLHAVTYGFPFTYVHKTHNTSIALCEFMVYLMALWDDMLCLI
jgi:hypothetical protein